MERGLPELLTVLAVNLKENYLLDPCVVSSTRSEECRFSSGNICARANGPPERKPPLRGSTRESGALDAEEATLPFHGAGSLGLNAPEGPTVKKEGSEKKKQKGRTEKCS